MTEKEKVEKQLKKALAALDTAVQKWYECNAPFNEDRYATCHIRTYPSGNHASNLTLRPFDNGYYVNIISSKETLNGSTHD